MESCCRLEKGRWNDRGLFVTLVKRFDIGTLLGFGKDRSGHRKVESRANRKSITD